MRLFRHHAVAVDIYKSLGLNLSLRIYCGISCRSSSQKLRDSSDGSNNQNLAGLRPHKEKVLGAASCTPGISGLGAEDRSTSWASPEAWAQRTPAGCEGRIPRCPGLGLAPDSELASVGVSIATYTYTWHPATAATLRGAGQAKPLRACGVAGCGGGAGLGRRVRIFGWPPP